MLTKQPNDKDILNLGPPPAYYYQLVGQQTHNLCNESMDDLVAGREIRFVESAVGTTPPFLGVLF